MAGSADQTKQKRGRAPGGRFQPETVPAIEAAPVPVEAPVAPEAAPVPPETVIELKPVAQAPVEAPAMETASAALMAEAIVDTTPEFNPAPAMAAASEKASNMAEQFNTTTTTPATTATVMGADRMREAVEKTTKSFEEMNEFAKGNVEALVAAGRAATAGFERMAQDAAEFSRKNFEATTAMVKSLGTVKTPADFFRVQNEFAKAQFDGVVAEMSKSTETMLKVVGEVVEPIQNRMALAADRVKTAVAR
jgi:phasin family protein